MNMLIKTAEQFLIEKFEQSEHFYRITCEVEPWS